jgi:hypothetical protein
MRDGSTQALDWSELEKLQIGIALVSAQTSAL